MWLVKDHNIPFGALELRFSGGAAIDPANKAGETNLVMALLEEGSGTITAHGFATGSAKWPRRSCVSLQR